MAVAMAALCMLVCSGLGILIVLTVVCSGHLRILSAADPHDCLAITRYSPGSLPVPAFVPIDLLR